jgi:hypothetical protein
MQHMGERRSTYKVLVGKTEEKRTLEDLAVDGRITLKCIWDGRGGMDWIDLAQDRDRWGAHVNAVMNLWVP